MTVVDAAPVLPDVRRLPGLLRPGGGAAPAGVVLIVVQVAVYAAWPPPATARGHLELLARDPLLGMLSLDLLYLLSNLLAFLVYLGLAVALWRAGRSAVVVALAFGVLGMAAYFASPRPVEMLALARAHEAAGPDARAALLATAEGMLATWKGTAFDVYYLFNLVTLLVLAVLMVRTAVFSRATAVWGLVAAALMAVPSNLGVVGLVFALASLLPWSVFAVLAGRRLLALARTAADPAGTAGGPFRPGDDAGPAPSR